MIQTSESLFRPYAPPANVLACLHRLRRMNMPAVITRDLLMSIGISVNIAPRVFATLRFLELVSDSSEPTDVLRGLAGSTEDEYHQLLEKTIRRAYAEEFEKIDPSVDTQERVMNAFQRYTPRSQHNRQVMLFLGLCREAVDTHPGCSQAPRHDGQAHVREFPGPSSSAARVTGTAARVRNSGRAAAAGGRTDD